MVNQTGEILRDRLLDRLANRWSTPVTVVRGSAGAGKTTLLRQARDANLEQPRGTDIVFACSEGDADASRLARRLGETLDLQRVIADSEHPALDLVDHIATRSPHSVCLHIDDAHRLGTDSTGAALLRRLFEERPANLTFVFATRAEVPIRLARSAATGELELIDGDEELFFDADELVRLGRTPTDLGGWPALLALDPAGSRGTAARDFVLEEVIEDLPDDVRNAIALLAGVGRLPVETVTERFGAAVAQSLAALPLVFIEDDGWLVAHDLWADTLDDRYESNVSEIVDELIRDGAHERALNLAREAADADAVERVLMAAVTTNAPAFPRDTAIRWLDTLGPEYAEHTATQLIAAAAGLLPADEALASVDRLTEEAAEAGDQPVQLAALAIAANRAYEAGRLDRVLQIRGELGALEPPLPAFLEAVQDGVDAVLADLSGDAAGAIEALGRIDFDAVPPLLAEQLVRLHVANHVVLGRALEVTAIAERVLAPSPRRQVAATPLVVRWFAGDPGGLRTDDDEHIDDEAVGPDLVISACFRTHMRAAFGHPQDRHSYRDEVLDAAGEAPRLQTMAVVARSLAMVVEGDEERAAALLREAFETLDPTNPVVASELLRFLPVAAVLVPESVDLEVARSSGPSHQRMAALTTLLLDARNGGGQLRAAIRPLTSDLITTFPLVWSVEFVARACAAGADWANDLAIEFFDEVGPAGRSALQALAEHPQSDLATAATTVLDTVPVPPQHPLHIDILGPLTLRSGSRVLDDPLLRRARVRQLLLLLTAHGGMTREELMDRLWPDAAPELAAKNLRTNLSHLRRLLEPDLGARGTSYFLRVRGDRLVVEGSVLTIDLERFDQELRTAADADDRGELATAAEGYERASALWRGTPFADIADAEGVVALQASLQRRSAFAATRAAEIRLARNDVDDAVALADRALVIAPYGEPAHRIRLAALLAVGEVDGLRAAVTRVEDLREEALLAITPETDMVLRRARDLLERAGGI